MTDYLNWQSELALEQVFEQGGSISYPSITEQGTFYLRQIDSRSVLMFIAKGAEHAQCITPEHYNLRTQISEYGGKPYWFGDDYIYFSNQSDQCLYKQALSNFENIEQLTSKSVSARYAEVTELHANVLFATAEIEQVDNQESKHALVAIVDKELIYLEQGADFYSNFVINSEKDKVAWVQWNHPSMPWDDTQLWIADLAYELGSNPQLNNKRQIHFGCAVSICQLLFATNGKLFFSVDYAVPTESWQNYWNVHCIDAAQINAQSLTLTVQAVTQLEQEFGYPHWQYGDSRIVQFDNNTLITFASTAEQDALYKIDVNLLTTSLINDSLGTIKSLNSDGHSKATFLKFANDKPVSLMSLNADYQVEPIIETHSPLAKNEISTAQHIQFKTNDGKHAYGFFYAPKNRRYINSDIPNKPPLIVMVHGGPTARCYGYFDIQKQFWTNLGFAILDVNHRGSNSYGRAYRDALYGQWGETDASDIVDGIAYLIEQGKVDGNRVCIRGKSAGGYAVLRALTEHGKLFAAGACYYGIGNLVTLAEHTHKFEKHYTDRLVDENYEPTRAQDKSSKFYQRSPINYMHQAQSPMIIFQGLLDKVVPPELANEVVEQLNELNLDCQHVEYADEAHGFRQAHNNIDAWTKELAFYKNTLVK